MEVVTQSTAARNLYAEIAEAATVVDVLLAAGPGKGAVKERVINARTYLYWQFRDVTGRVRQLYLGPDDESVRARIRAVEANRRRLDDVRESLMRLTAAFMAAGGMRHLPAHFKVLEALAMGGLFSKGAVLVGSHAFIALGNLLGYSWAGATATQDIDFGRSDGVEVAVDPHLRLDVPKAMQALDMGFFLVPDLDPRKPSTSLQTNKARIKVDFLMPIRRGTKTAPVILGDLGIAAQPLRFMDYLLGAPVQRGFVIGAWALPVLLPSPGRFALHKLVVAEERPVSSVAKSEKDRRQAAQVILALQGALPGELAEAARSAADYPGVRVRLERALAKMRAVSKEAAAGLETVLPAAARRK